MRTLAPRESKLVAVGIAILLLVLGYLLIVAPIVAGFSARAAQRDQIALTYQHNARLIAAIPQLRRRAEAQHAEESRFAAQATTPDAATLYLKDRMRRELIAVGAAPKGGDAIEAPAGRVRVWAEAELSLSQMTTVLKNLQSLPPYLVIESVAVVAEQALATGHLETMDVKIDVSIPYSSGR